MIGDPQQALATLEAVVRDASLAELPAVIGRLEALRVAALARLTPPQPQRPNDGDRLLTIEETAQRLGVTVPWLRRRPTLPFVVKLSDGVVRYSTRGLDRFIRQHMVSD